MAGARWRFPGGIQGLLDLHDEHPETLDRDLIALGLRWRDVGSEALTWGDMLAIVRASPPGTGMYRVLSPGGAGWTTTDYVLADVFDAIAALRVTVVRSQGGKARRPKPYPRPGVKPTHTDSKTFGYTPMPIDELNRVLGWTDRPEVQRG